MHEISVLSTIMGAAVSAAKDKGALKIITLKIRIGSLTHLSREQLAGCWEFLRDGDPLTAEAVLDFEVEEPLIVCPDCDWKGMPELVDIGDGKKIPSLRCIKCGAQAVVEKGNDCILTGIVIDV
ncbi:MAG: hydrogenase/urease maturation nickel metallochaperone HypA [Thermoplasmata archaeon]